MADLYVSMIPSRDPRLGRHVVHDPRSFSRARLASLPIGPVDKSTWKTVTNSVLDPYPNPDQTIGNCTGCAKAMAFNSAKQRTAGVVHKMPMADRLYSIATSIDPWQGEYPPEDTGSDGLSAAKAAQQVGIGGPYWFLRGGADQVVQAIQERWVVNCGTVWLDGMFKRIKETYGYRINVRGDVAGGHEYTARAYNKTRDQVMIRCWWGDFRDVWVARTALDELLHQDGDANIQAKA